MAVELDGAAVDPFRVREADRAVGRAGRRRLRAGGRGRGDAECADHGRGGEQAAASGAPPVRGGADAGSVHASHRLGSRAVEPPGRPLDAHPRRRPRCGLRPLRFRRADGVRGASTAMESRARGPRVAGESSVRAAGHRVRVAGPGRDRAPARDHDARRRVGAEPAAPSWPAAAVSDAHVRDHENRPLRGGREGQADPAPRPARAVRPAGPDRRERDAGGTHAEGGVHPRGRRSPVRPVQMVGGVAVERRRSTSCPRSRPAPACSPCPSASERRPAHRDARARTRCCAPS